VYNIKYHDATYRTFVLEVCMEWEFPFPWDSREIPVGFPWE